MRSLHFFGPASVARLPWVACVTARDLVHLLDEAGIQLAVVFSVAYQWSHPNPCASIATDRPERTVFG